MYSNALPTDAEAVFKDLIPWWLASITPPIYPSNCSASPFCPPFPSFFLSHFFFHTASLKLLLNDFILSFIFFLCDTSPLRFPILELLSLHVICTTMSPKELGQKENKIKKDLNCLGHLTRFEWHAAFIPLGPQAWPTTQACNTLWTQFTMKTDVLGHLSA